MIIRFDSRAFMVLNEIVENSKKSQIGLTLEEIGDRVGLTHRSTVHHHVSRLIDNGLVDRVPGRAKSLQPTVKGHKMVELIKT